MKNSTIEEALAPLRKELDTVNDRLLALLSRRAELSLLVAEVKGRHQADIHNPDREAEMLAALREGNPGPMSNEDVTAIFRAILDASVRLMKG